MIHTGTNLVSCLGSPFPTRVAGSGIAKLIAGSLVVHFQTMSVFDDYLCGIDLSGHIACYDTGNVVGIPSNAPPPAGLFVSVACGTAVACALSATGFAQCWTGDPTLNALQVRSHHTSFPKPISRRPCR